jgi:hypothetical protein
VIIRIKETLNSAYNLYVLAASAVQVLAPVLCSSFQSFQVYAVVKRGHGVLSGVKWGQDRSSRVKCQKKSDGKDEIR